MRNVKEFTILTKKNKLAFLPGEILKGELYLCFEKAIPIKSLKIILCGDGEGQWLIQSARPEAKQDGKKKILIDVGLLVFGFAENNEKSLVHDRGRFVYDFEFNIPHNLPVSFKSPPDKNLGYARYFLKAILCRPKKRDKIKKFNIVINELIDPDRPELAFQPGSYKEKNVRAGLVPCGSLSLESYLNQSQYVQGQSVFINTIAHNKSSKIMKEVYAKLIRRTCCKSLCGASTFMIDTTSLHESRLGPYGKLVWTNKELKIPAVGPTITRNDDIRVDYIVRVGMYEEMGSEIHIDLPVIIGTMQNKGEAELDEKSKDVYDRKKTQYCLQLVKTVERDTFRQNLHQKVIQKTSEIPNSEKNIKPYLEDEINTAVDNEKMFASFDGDDEIYVDNRHVPKNGKNKNQNYEKSKSTFIDEKQNDKNSRNLNKSDDNEVLKTSEKEMERSPSQNGKIHNFPETIVIHSKDLKHNTLDTPRFNVKDEKKEEEINIKSSCQKAEKKPIDLQFCGDNLPDIEYEKKRIGKNKFDKKMQDDDECKDRKIECEPTSFLLRKSSFPSHSLSKKGVNASTGSLNISSSGSLNKNLGVANKSLELSSNSRSSLKKQANFLSDPSLKIFKGGSERKGFVSPFKKNSGSLNKSADSLINKDSNLPLKSNLKKSSGNLNNSTGSISNRESLPSSSLSNREPLPSSSSLSTNSLNGLASSAEREPIFLTKSSLPKNTESLGFLEDKKKLIFYKQNDDFGELHERNKNYSQNYSGSENLKSPSHKQLTTKCSKSHDENEQIDQNELLYPIQNKKNKVEKEVKIPIRSSTSENSETQHNEGYYWKEVMDSEGEMFATPPQERKQKKDKKHFKKKASNVTNEIDDTDVDKKDFNDGSLNEEFFQRDSVTVKNELYGTNKQEIKQPSKFESAKENGTQKKLVKKNSEEDHNLPSTNLLLDGKDIMTQDDTNISKRGNKSEDVNSKYSNVKNFDVIENKEKGKNENVVASLNSIPNKFEKTSNAIGFFEKIFGKQKPQENQIIKPKPGEDRTEIPNEDKCEIQLVKDKHKSLSAVDKQKKLNEDKQEIKQNSDTGKPKTLVEKKQEVKRNPVEDKHRPSAKENHDNKQNLLEDKLKAEVLNLSDKFNQDVKGTTGEDNQDVKQTTGEDKHKTLTEENHEIKQKLVDHKQKTLVEESYDYKQKPVEIKLKADVLGLSSEENQEIKRKSVKNKDKTFVEENQDNKQKSIEDNLKTSGEYAVKRVEEYKKKTFYEDKKAVKVKTSDETKEEIKINEKNKLKPKEIISETKHEEVLLKKTNEKQGEKNPILQTLSNKDNYETAVMENTEPTKKALILKNDKERFEKREEKNPDLTEIESAKSCKQVKQTQTSAETNFSSKNDTNLYQPMNFPMNEEISSVREISKLKQESLKNYAHSFDNGFGKVEKKSADENNSFQIETLYKKTPNNDELSKKNDNTQDNFKKDMYPPSPLKSSHKNCSKLASKVNAPANNILNIRNEKEVENDIHETIEYYCDDSKCWKDELYKRRPIYQTNIVREDRFNSNTSFEKEPIKSRIQKENNNNSFEYAKKKKHPKTQIAFGRTVKLVEQKNKLNPNEMVKTKNSSQPKIKSYSPLKTSSDGKNNDNLYDEVEQKTLLGEKTQTRNSFGVNSIKSHSIKINSKIRNKTISENVFNDKLTNSAEKKGNKPFQKTASEKYYGNSIQTSDMINIHKSNHHKIKDDQPLRYQYQTSSCSPEIEIFSNNLLIEENKSLINSNISTTVSSMSTRPIAYRVMRTSNGNIGTNKKPDARVVTNKVRSFAKGGDKKDERNKEIVEHKNISNSAAFNRNKLLEKQKPTVIKRDSRITDQNPIKNFILNENQHKIKLDKQSESREKEKSSIPVADKANPIYNYFDSLNEKEKLSQENNGDKRQFSQENNGDIRRQFFDKLKGTKLTTDLNDRQKINKANELRISLNTTGTPTLLKNQKKYMRHNEDKNEIAKVELKYGRYNENINDDIKAEMKYRRYNQDVNNSMITEIDYEKCNENLKDKTKIFDNGQKPLLQKVGCNENSQFNIDWSRVPKFIDSKKDWHKPNCRWSDQKRQIENLNSSEKIDNLDAFLIPLKTKYVTREKSSLNNANQQVDSLFQKRSREYGKQPLHLENGQKYKMPKNNINQNVSEFSEKEIVNKQNNSENDVSESEEYNLSRKLPKLPKKHLRSKSFEPTPKSEILSELLKNREALSPIYRTNLGPIHSYVGHIERLDNSLNNSKDLMLTLDEENIKKENKNTNASFPYHPIVTELILNSHEKELQLPSVPVKEITSLTLNEKNNRSNISETVETDNAKKLHSYAWIVDIENAKKKDKKSYERQAIDLNVNELIDNKTKSSGDNESGTVSDPDKKYDFLDLNKNIKLNDFRKKGKILVPKKYFSSNKKLGLEPPKKGLSRSMSMKMKPDSSKIVMRSRSVEPHSSTKHACLVSINNIEKPFNVVNNESKRIESDINTKTSHQNKIKEYDVHSEKNNLTKSLFKNSNKRASKKSYSKFKISSKKPKYDVDLLSERSKQQKYFTYTQIYAKKKKIQVESPGKTYKNELSYVDVPKVFKKGSILGTKTHRIRTVSEPLPEKNASEILPNLTKNAWENNETEGRLVSYQYTPIEELTHGSEDSQDENEWSQKINDYIKKIKEKSNIYRVENSTNCGYHSLAPSNLPGETSYGKNLYTNKHNSTKEVLSISSVKSDASIKIPPKSAVRPLVNSDNSENSYTFNNISCVEAVAVNHGNGFKSQINNSTTKTNKRFRLEDSFDQHEKSLGIVDESGNVRSNKQLMATNESEWILEEKRRLQKIQQRKHDRFIKDLKSYKIDRPSSCPSTLGPREAIFDYHSKNMYQDVTCSETETEYTTDDEESNDDFTNAFCSLEDSLPKVSIESSSPPEKITNTDAKIGTNIKECKLINNIQNNGAENEEVQSKQPILKEKAE
ncbi:uncharacterized protein PF3D7_1120600 [Hydra vulgaris]|uniref:Uncharacterized protein PF3D7_1120600 n=1 Tax=Hydra vulgaris TaxID=6087 RepID=A0ABM4BIW3_HYDVU